MLEFQPLDQARLSAADASGVSLFASQVVSLLADRSARSATEPREELIASLVAASLSGTKAAFADLLSEIRRSRISRSALSDVYIPLAARRMGEAWLDDELSWIDVTIGVSRMQSLLREIGAAWVADQASDGGHGTVMFILPEHEQHTLGPMVAIGQLRRFGISVCLRIAPGPGELRDLMAARRFDGIIISVATREKLRSVARTVELLRTIKGSPAPIIVGGAVMSGVEDPASCTGADFSANDIGAALEVMGLKFDAYRALKRA
jgi:hypothetical protein